MNDKLYKLAKEKSMTLDEIAQTWIQMDYFITNIYEMMEQIQFSEQVIYLDSEILEMFIKCEVDINDC